MALSETTADGFQAACDHLCAADPVMKTIIETVGPRPIEFDDDWFALLVKSILYQQVALSAAEAVINRLTEHVGPPGLTPENLGRFSVDELRSCGLSSQKAQYVAGLTSQINDGTLVLQQISQLPDDLAVKQLTRVKGIGPWTAHMFLIFGLRRPDVFPGGDLGIRKVIREQYGLADLPDEATALAIAAKWRPYASVATWYCWRLAERERNLRKAAKTRAA